MVSDFQGRYQPLKVGKTPSGELWVIWDTFKGTRKTGFLSNKAEAEMVAKQFNKEKKK